VGGRNSRRLWKRPKSKRGVLRLVCAPERAATATLEAGRTSSTAGSVGTVDIEEGGCGEGSTRRGCSVGTVSGGGGGGARRGDITEGRGDMSCALCGCTAGCGFSCALSERVHALITLLVRSVETLAVHTSQLTLHVSVHLPPAESPPPVSA
jgi:hypothetical protein